MCHFLAARRHDRIVEERPERPVDPVERARRELDVGLEAPRGKHRDALGVEVARVEVALVRDGVKVARHDDRRRHRRPIGPLAPRQVEARVAGLAGRVGEVAAPEPVHQSPA